MENWAKTVMDSDKRRNRMERTAAVLTELAGVGKQRYPSPAVDRDRLLSEYGEAGVPLDEVLKDCSGPERRNLELLAVQLPVLAVIDMARKGRDA